MKFNIRKYYYIFANIKRKDIKYGNRSDDEGCSYILQENRNFRWKSHLQQKFSIFLLRFHLAEALTTHIACDTMFLRWFVT